MPVYCFRLKIGDHMASVESVSLAVTGEQVSALKAPWTSVITPHERGRARLAETTEAEIRRATWAVVGSGPYQRFVGRVDMKAVRKRKGKVVRTQLERRMQKIHGDGNIRR